MEKGYLVFIEGSWFLEISNMHFTFWLSFCWNMTLNRFLQRKTCCLINNLYQHFLHEVLTRINFWNYRRIECTYIWISEFYATGVLFLVASQPAVTCSKLTMETIEQSVKYVQSYHLNLLFLFLTLSR